MREELGAERVRREQAEQERDRLAAELEALRETENPPVRFLEEPYSTHAPPAPEHPVERLSWWRRFFWFD